jgi:hypothetical protein
MLVAGVSFGMIKQAEIVPAKYCGGGKVIAIG